MVTTRPVTAVCSLSHVRMVTHSRISPVLGLGVSSGTRGMGSVTGTRTLVLRQIVKKCWRRRRRVGFVVLLLFLLLSSSYYYCVRIRLY